MRKPEPTDFFGRNDQEKGSSGNDKIPLGNRSPKRNDLRQQRFSTSTPAAHYGSREIGRQ
jgi:hypothetical protein